MEALNVESNSTKYAQKNSTISIGYSKASGALKDLADGLFRGLIRLARSDGSRRLHFICGLSICKVQRMQSHPMIATHIPGWHALWSSSKKDQNTQRQVQVIVLRSIVHKKLGWHKQVNERCRHRRMLKSGGPFK